MTSHKNVNNRSDSLLTSTHQNRKTELFFFFVSFALHGLFFISLLFIYDFKLPKSMPQVIQVDLVSFSPDLLVDEPPPAADVKTTEKGIPEKPRAIKKKKTSVRHIKADISLKTKPKNLKKLMAKKKVIKKKDTVKKKERPIIKEAKEKKIAPEKIAKTVKDPLDKKKEDKNQQKISDALAKLQKKVKEQGKNKGKFGKSAYTGMGNRGSKPLEMYHRVIGYSIEQNWVFNDILARLDKDLEVRILIKILKSGEIRDIIYETKSGNRYLDESAKKAVKKANPLPPLPTGMLNYDIGLIFTPKGLK